MFSKTSSVRRTLDSEINALKEQEELQARLEKLRREDKEIELARKARITEKE